MSQAALALLCFYALHSLLLLPKVQLGFRQWFRLSAKQYRMFYNVLSVLLFSGVVYLAIIEPKNYFIEYNRIKRFLAGLLLYFAFKLAYRGFKSYNLSIFLGLKEEVQMPLNTGGMNQYIRHPLYTASIVFFLALFVSSSHQVFLEFLLITLLYVPIGYSLEEKRMLKHFPEYQQYAAQTPALWPKFEQLGPWFKEIWR